MSLPPYFMVFDVESVGLHGGGFAVGWVVVNTAEGVTLEENLLACDPAHAHAHDEVDRAWIAGEVVPALSDEAWPRGPMQYVEKPEEVRELFWTAWKYWKERGAWLAADVAWPVEARFLSACIDTAPTVRGWQGPYPLVDIASVRLAVGLDPLGTEERRENEKPAHNPLADARQSARLLIEALAAARPPQPVEVA